MDISIRGKAFNVEISNPNQHSKTLVWSHGLFGDMRDETTLDIIDFDAIAQHCQLIRYDARSHGATQWDEDASHLTWSQLAEDMLAIANYFELPRFMVGGSSMGAGTALWAAVKAHHSIDGMVLNILPSSWEQRFESIDLYQKMIDLIEKRGIEVLCEQIQSLPMPSNQSVLQQQRDRLYAELATKGDEHAITLLTAAIKSNLPDKECLAFLNMPTLILAWENFIGHPAESAKDVHELLENSELIVSSGQKQAQQDALKIVEFVNEV